MSSKQERGRKQGSLERESRRVARSEEELRGGSPATARKQRGRSRSRRSSRQRSPTSSALRGRSPPPRDHNNNRSSYSRKRHHHRRGGGGDHRERDRDRDRSTSSASLPEEEEHHRRKRKRTTSRRRFRSLSPPRPRSRPRPRSNRQRHAPDVRDRDGNPEDNARPLPPPPLPPPLHHHHHHQQPPPELMRNPFLNRPPEHNDDNHDYLREQQPQQQHRRRGLSADHRHRRPRSYSVDRPRPRRRHHSRRRRRHRRRHKRRSRSYSPSISSASSSSSSSSASSRPPPRHQLVPVAGVVSDDDEGNNGGNSFAHHHRGGGQSDGQQLPQPPPKASRRTRANNNASSGARQHSNTNSHKRKRGKSNDKSCSQANDDTVGHFWGGPGTIVAEKYRVVRELGVGTFGRVVECIDLSSKKTNKNNNSSNRKNINNNDNHLVAIKMVRKVKRYYESALIEADIVSDVNRRGGPRGRGISHFAVMYDAFNFRGHYCLVFESLGPSLYDYLKRNKYQPFPMHCIRDFAKQLLEAIEFVHSFRLIHTDLKPENILLTKCREISYGYQTIPESTRIKVIDFGGATYDDEKKSSVVNTRQYRAPEVILGTGWSMPADLWSVGCILAELYQGELLFATHDNLEHLALMERIIGPFPHRMLQRAKQQNASLASQAFDSNGRHRMGRVLPPENTSYVLNTPSLESIVRKQKDAWFLELLRRILVIDPDARSSARDSLRASFG